MAVSERSGEQASERPSERRSAARSIVLWRALEAVLSPVQRRVVLDIGGGTGGLAVRVAGLGHDVTVVDPSPDALAALGRRAAEEGVEVTGHLGDLSGLGDMVAPGSVDVVLCHGVLEVVPDPAAAVAALASVLRPGGTLSLLVAQRHAAVVARALSGQFQQAKEILDGDDSGRAGHRFTADEAVELLRETGFEVADLHGIRIFADLVPGSLLDLDPATTAALVELEMAASRRPEYLHLASQVHVLATR